MNQSEEWSEKEGEGTEAGIEPTIPSVIHTEGRGFDSRFSPLA